MFVGFDTPGLRGDAKLNGKTDTSQLTSVQPDEKNSRKFNSRAKDIFFAAILCQLSNR